MGVMGAHKGGVCEVSGFLEAREAIFGRWEDELLYRAPELGLEEWITLLQ